MALSVRLARKGFKVDVLTTDPSGTLNKSESISGFAVKRFRSWAPSRAYYFSPDICRFLSSRSADYDIIHAHNYHAMPAFCAAMAKKRNGFVFNPHYHGTGHTLFRRLLHYPYKLLGKTIFEKSDRVICVSEYEKSLVEATFGEFNGKIRIVPIGVDLTEFQSLTKKTGATRRILCVSRLEDYKRIDCLLRALPYLELDVHVEIVGAGPARRDLLRLADRLNLRERVVFYENLPREELLDRYSNGSLLVSLSRHEAFGLTVAEALAARVPCVVANSSALRDWVDGKNCLGVDNPEDPVEVAAAMKRGLSTTVETQNIRDWDEITDEITEIYMQVNKSQSF